MLPLAARVSALRACAAVVTVVTGHRGFWAYAAYSHLIMHFLRSDSDSSADSGSESDAAGLAEPVNPVMMSLHSGSAG